VRRLPVAGLRLVDDFSQSRFKRHGKSGKSR
jgi:hypothetical protein